MTRKAETDLERVAVMATMDLPFSIAAQLTVSDEELAKALAHRTTMAGIGMAKPVTEDPAYRLALVYLAYHRPDLLDINPYELEANR